MSLTQMYKALVRSHLDYCDFIYHVLSIIHQPPLGDDPQLSNGERYNIIEIIQYQTALAITGAWQGTSRSKMYYKLGWETPSGRRKCRRVLQIHKIINNITLSHILKINYLLTSEKCLMETFIILLFMQ